MQYEKLFDRQEVRVTVVALVIIAAIIAASVLTALPKEVRSAAGAPLSGYLWSDTVGWIDLNCLNTGICGSNNFGMSVGSDNKISGYAWSENIGWVSANIADVAVCGSQALISGANVTGWLRAIAGGTSQSGGWDGCISLSGSGYGVTYNASTGKFAGYAWGDINLGWVSFAHAGIAADDTAHVVASCVPQNLCVSNTYSYQDSYCFVSTVKVCTGTCTLGGCSEDLTPPSALEISAVPSVIRQGGSIKLHWSSADANTCTVKAGSVVVGSGTASPVGGLSVVVNDETTYTLTCTNDGGSTEDTVLVRITPIFQEF